MLEQGDRLKSVDEVCGGAFLGVGEVEEERAAGANGQGGEDALDQIGEDRSHIGNHRPVDEGYEIAGGEGRAVAVDASECGRDVSGRDVIEATHCTEHELAVGELYGGGVCGLGERDYSGASSEVSEDGVYVAAAEGADVGDAGAVGEKGVAHDRAVAAEFIHARVELEVGALAGGAEDALAERGNSGERREVIALAGALVDGGHDRVDETIEANEGGFLSEGAAMSAEFLESAGFKVHVGARR